MTLNLKLPDLKLSDLKHIIVSWKSTLRGLATSFLGISSMILAVKANPAQDPSIAALVNFIPAHWLVTIAAVSGFIRIMSGALATDPGKEDVKAPASVPTTPSAQP